MWAYNSISLPTKELLYVQELLEDQGIYTTYSVVEKLTTIACTQRDFNSAAKEVIDKYDFFRRNLPPFLLWNDIEIFYAGAALVSRAESSVVLEIAKRIYKLSRYALRPDVIGVLTHAAAVSGTQADLAFQKYQEVRDTVASTGVMDLAHSVSIAHAYIVSGASYQDFRGMFQQSLSAGQWTLSEESVVQSIRSKLCVESGPKLI